MLNILSVDVEDWFHILDVSGAPPLERWARLESRVERNFRLVLDLLDRHAVKCTCFFLGWIAERFPLLVQEAARRGHEIASHGYAHRLIYTQTREQFLEDITRAKHIIEQASGRAVLGYRAPGFSIVDKTPWALEELARAGYKYDSSIFPAARGHGGIAGAEKRPHLVKTPAGSIVEFPISVAEILGRRLCVFGGGYLRLFPYPLIKLLSEAVNREGRPVIYYVHPREVDPSQPRLPMGLARRFKSYVNLKTTEPKLSALMRDQELTAFSDWLVKTGTFPEVLAPA